MHLYDLKINGQFPVKFRVCCVFFFCQCIDLQIAEGMQHLLAVCKISSLDPLDDNNDTAK